MQRLKEIDIIRCVVIIVLVMYHSFAPFTGAWDLPVYLSPNVFYEKLDKLLYAGMLESFVCISGYVFAYSINYKKYRLKTLLVSKFKRLYIPCLVWGIIYILVMYSFHDFFMLETYSKLINGIGHLWFLPMLFWCFMFEFIFLKYKDKLKSPLLFLAVIAVLPYFTLPLRVNNSLYYLFFFNWGVVLFQFRDKFAFYLNKRFLLILLVGCFILLYNSGKMLVSLPILNLEDVTLLWHKALILFCHHVIRFSYSILVVFLYFALGYKLSCKCVGRKYSIIKFIATHSFGIYLSQEIILRVLYYKMNVFNELNMLCPWMNFIITFFFSLLISFLLSTNRFTKSIC